MQDYRVQQAQIYTDFSGLNALKSEARTDKKAALEVVARHMKAWADKLRVEIPTMSKRDHEAMKLKP